MIRTSLARGCVLSEHTLQLPPGPGYADAWPILRLNDVDPKAWLANVLARSADLPTSRLPERLPWWWKRIRQAESSFQQAA